MIIFPIDDVCDLKLGKSVKFYNSRKMLGLSPKFIVDRIVWHHL